MAINIKATAKANRHAQKNELGGAGRARLPITRAEAIKLLSIMLAGWAICFTTFISEGQATDIDTLAHKLVVLEGTPGLAVVIIERGEAPSFLNYGVRSLRSQQPITEDTVFAIASATKAFTALSVGILVDEGLLDWDDLVRDHVPAFSVGDPYVTAHTTIRDLLAHRTGTIRGDIVWFGNPQLKGAKLIERYATLPQQTSFRESFAYSNLMYVVAGELIPAKSGMSWEDFTKRKLFRPLQMRSASTTSSPLPDGANTAGLHAFNGERVAEFVHAPPADNTGPAGGIRASTRDLAAWIHFWIERAGESTRQTLVSDDTFSAITSLQNIIRGRSPIDAYMHDTGAPFGYGLGWFIGEYRGAKVMTHLGGGDGVGSLVSWMPDHGVGVAVLANTESTLGRIAIRNAVFSNALNETKEDHFATFKSLQAQSREALQAAVVQAQPPVPKHKKSGPALSLDAYHGLYESPLYGDLRIERANDGLTATFGAVRVHRLSRLNETTFKVHFQNPSFNWPRPTTLQFELNGEGTAPASVELKAVGQSATYTLADPN
jgi:CubicO group peptidase (beta-lactamase class C family)